jgi:hypothetical protein
LIEGDAAIDRPAAGTRHGLVVWWQQSGEIVIELIERVRHGMDQFDIE